MNWGSASGVVAESRERVGEGGVHLVAQHDYATAIDLLVPIVENLVLATMPDSAAPPVPSHSRLSNSRRVFGRKRERLQRGEKQMREKERWVATMMIGTREREREREGE